MSPLLDWLVEHEPSFRKSRLPSLYSDLSVQKNSNPDGYAANVTAWQAALTRAAIAGRLSTNDRFSIHTADELLDCLSSPQYGRPSGLGSVIDESVRSGRMIPRQDFLTADRGIYHKSWVPSPWSILQWSLRQIGLTNNTYDNNGRLKKGDLVLVQALEEASKQILAVQTTGDDSLTGRITSREHFSQGLSELYGHTFSGQEITTLLRYLSRDKQALAYDSQTIKFKSPASSIVEPITPQDTTIASLKTIISSLTTQINTLTARVSSFDSQAKSCLQKGNKTTALSALRSKKLAQQSLAQRQDNLLQLEQVFTSIQAAADQVDMVRIMEQSTSVLKGLNKQVGDVDQAEDIMEQLREEMVKVDEVGGVINEPLTSDAVVEEGEINEEMEEMEKAQRDDAERREAERTRKRLAELEKEMPVPASTDVEQQVDTSTRKLSQIDLEERTALNENQQRKSPKPEKIVEE